MSTESGETPEHSWLWPKNKIIGGLDCWKDSIVIRALAFHVANHLFVFCLLGGREPHLAMLRFTKQYWLY